MAMCSETFTTTSAGEQRALGKGTYPFHSKETSTHPTGNRSVKQYMAPHIGRTTTTFAGQQRV